MQNNTYEIGSRKYSALDLLSIELNFSIDKNYLFKLDNLNVINVSGQNASDFLQGQLSCDLNKVNQKNMQQGAMCNLKGRVLGLPDVLYWNGNVLIINSEDNILKTIDSLSKTAMFSQVKLEASSNYRIYGLYVQNDSDHLPDNIRLPVNLYELTSYNEKCCYKIGSQFFIIVTTDDHIENLFKLNNQFRGSLAWHSLRLQHKSFEIYPETRGLFLPHRLGLQSSGHISFNKGCYKGQEIIARTHYKAKLKHEIALVTADINTPITLGSSIYSNDKSEIGEIIDYAPIDDKRILIMASLLIERPAILLTSTGSQLLSYK